MSSIKRNTLILIICCAQLVLLVVGVGYFTQWLQGEVTQLVGGQIQADNQVILEQTQAYLEALQPNELTEGGENWQRVQRQVEKLTLPNKGTVFLLDPQSGKLVCHPRLRVERQLRHQDFSRLEFHGEQSVPLSQAVGAGWYETTDGLSFAVVGDVPGLPYKLFVRQDAGASGRAVSQVLGSARLMLILGPFLLALLAGFAAYELARRFETSQQRAPESSVRDAVKARNAVAFGLANLAELRDAESGHHLIRIRAFVRLLADQLKIRHQQLRDEGYMQDLVQASTLHDLGKVGVRESILLKPGKLSVDERREMQKHTLVADCYLTTVAQQLEEDRFFQIARQIAVAHHERWDGGGYPFGLVGDQIPLAARIVALADVYDALTSRRTYRARMSFDHARDLIVKGSGVQFDPEVVEAFTHCEADFRRIAELREPPAEETADVVLFDGLRARSGKLPASKLANLAEPPQEANESREAARSTPATIVELHSDAVATALADHAGQKPGRQKPGRQKPGRQKPGRQKPGHSSEAAGTAAPLRAEMAGDPLDPSRVEEFKQREKAKPAFQSRPQPKQATDKMARHAAATLTAGDLEAENEADANPADHADPSLGAHVATPEKDSAPATPPPQDSVSEDQLEEQLRHSAETLQFEASQAAAKPTAAQPAAAKSDVAAQQPATGQRAAAKTGGDPPPGTPEWMNMWQEIFHSQGDQKSTPPAKSGE